MEGQLWHLQDTDFVLKNLGHTEIALLKEDTSLTSHYSGRHF